MDSLCKLSWLPTWTPLETPRNFRVQQSLKKSCISKNENQRFADNFAYYTLLDGRLSPGYGKTGRMAGTGQGDRFSLSGRGRYSAIEKGTLACM